MDPVTGCKEPLFAPLDFSAWTRRFTPDIIWGTLENRPICLKEGSLK